MAATTGAMAKIVDRGDQPKERYQAAAEAADEFLAMKPETTPSSVSKSTILRTIGAAYYHVGRCEESTRLGHRAIALNSGKGNVGDAFSWCRIAMARFKLGHVKEAQASLKSAIAAAQGAEDKSLSNLLATATQLIDPPASRPRRRTRLGSSRQSDSPLPTRGTAGLRNRRCGDVVPLRRLPEWG
jgi:hypothetical protein